MLTVGMNLGLAFPVHQLIEKSIQQNYHWL